MKVKTEQTCKCSGRPQVCTVCLKKGEYKAPRAGTQGFRPPEVLLKYTEQTTGEIFILVKLNICIHAG